MADVKLITPGMTVWLDTGDTWHVTTGNPDLIAWDKTAARHKWPSFRDAPFMWLTFLAWHASRRQGRLPDPGMSYEKFEAAALRVTPDDDDTDDADDDDALDTDGPGFGGLVDPTRTDRDTG